MSSQQVTDITALFTNIITQNAMMALINKPAAADGSNSENKLYEMLLILLLPELVKKILNFGNLQLNEYIYKYVEYLKNKYKPSIKTYTRTVDIKDSLVMSAIDTYISKNVNMKDAIVSFENDVLQQKPTESVDIEIDQVKIKCNKQIGRCNTCNEFQDITSECSYCVPCYTKNSGRYPKEIFKLASTSTTNYMFTSISELNIINLLN